MGRLCFFVATVLMLSAISLVTARYQARQLYVELDRSRSAARDLGITWRQLQLDRAEHSSNSHVDKVARESLQMIWIVPNQTIYINQPLPAVTTAVPSNSAEAAGKSGGGR